MKVLSKLLVHTLIVALFALPALSVVHAQFNSLPTDGGTGFNNQAPIEQGSGFNSAAGGTNQKKLVACSGSTDCDFDKLVETAQNVMDFLIILATSIAVIVIAYAGFMYMTSGENSGKVKKAHELMWYAVVGFLVAISAYLVVDVLLNTLEVDPSVRPAGFTGN
ncbi:MAG: Type secretion system pilin [Candidatus Parcubacteria bacterium]|jgi:hypothetical protein